MHEISRRTLLKGAAAFASTSLLFPMALGNGAKKGFRFVHFTDIHIQPELGADKGTSLAIKKLLSLNPRPDFVITGGDHVMDLLSVTGERAETQFKLYAEAMKPLEMPIHHAVGNHDIYGWSASSPITTNDPKYGKKLWEEKVAEDTSYRSFDHKGVHFIVLDSIAPTPDRNWKALIEDDQLSWLKSDLEKTGKTTPIIVTCHVPVLTIETQIEKGTHADPGSGIVYNGKELVELWRPYNVKTVLQGHTHVVDEAKYLDTRYITGGAVCGEWWKGPRLGIHPEGFMVYDVSPEGVKWEYIAYGWHAQSASAA